MFEHRFIAPGCSSDAHVPILVASSGGQGQRTVGALTCLWVYKQQAAMSADLFLS